MLPGILRCHSCSALLNLRSHDRAEEEKVYLDKPFDTALDLSEIQYEWFNKILARHPVTKKTLLDFGCGTGGFLWHASRDGWSVEGIELNPDSALKASTRLGGGIFSGSFYEYPGPQHPVESVTFWDSLDQLLQPDEALRRARTWVIPEGSVVIRVRNGPWHYWARRAQDLLEKLGLLKSGRYVGVIHRYGFTRKSLEQLLIREGFGELSWQSADFTRKGRWMNSLRLKELVLGLYSLAAKVAFRLTGGRVYLFSSLLVHARAHQRASDASE